VFRI